MGLAPKQRGWLYTEQSAFAALVPVPLSDGPTELTMAREKRGNGALRFVEILSDLQQRLTSGVADIT
jgi:hypothetical protein